LQWLTLRLPSAIRHSFHFFGVPGALHYDLCGSGVELPEITLGEFDGKQGGRKPT